MRVGGDRCSSMAISRNQSQSVAIRCSSMAISDKSTRTCPTRTPSSNQAGHWPHGTRGVPSSWHRRTSDGRRTRRRTEAPIRGIHVLMSKGLPINLNTCQSISCIPINTNCQSGPIKSNQVLIQSNQVQSSPNPVQLGPIRSYLTHLGRPRVVISAPPKQRSQRRGRRAPSH